MLLERGEVKCEAACDYATNGSGYGIITKSVPLLVVEDRDYGSRAGLFPAEGRFGGGFCGWGVYSAEIAANLAWMRDTLFAELMSVLKDAGGFPMKDLFSEARRMGDELHSCQKAIDALKLEGDEAVGASIIARAIEAPLRKLVNNAGQEAALVIANVKKATGTNGYNVRTGEYCDLLKAGVVDPAKVTRSALQNAASIAGLLLTTDCMVTDLPEKKESCGCGGHGGAPDMGGMM
jgi:hypothetical protein